MERAKSLALPWTKREGVIGIYVVGSATRPYRDELSDYDIEVVVTDEVWAMLPDEERHVFVIDEGPPRRVDHEFYLWPWTEFAALLYSRRDLFHAPYRNAVVLHDPEGRIGPVVAALAELPDDVREERLRVHYLEFLFGLGRAKKTLTRRPGRSPLVAVRRDEGGPGSECAPAEPGPSSAVSTRFGRGHAAEDQARRGVDPGRVGDEEQRRMAPRGPAESVRPRDEPGLELDARLVTAEAITALVKLCFLAKGAWPSTRHWSGPELRLLGVPEEIVDGALDALRAPAAKEAKALADAVRAWLDAEGLSFHRDDDALVRWAYLTPEGKSAFEHWGAA